MIIVKQSQSTRVLTQSRVLYFDKTITERQSTCCYIYESKYQGELYHLVCLGCCMFIYIHQRARPSQIAYIVFVYIYVFFNLFLMVSRMLRGDHCTPYILFKAVGSFKLFSFPPLGHLMFYDGTTRVLHWSIRHTYYVRSSYSAIRRSSRTE